VETKVWNSREQLERFEIEPGSRQGPLRVERDLLLRGCVTGDVVVPSGKRLQINGAVLGNVTVEQGAQVEVNGFVRDALRVNGGRAVIRGIVDGEIVDEADAELVIEATAFVGGHAVAS
jgi:cytoskeletal protein CcmA (bactofilin family)